MSEYRHLAMGQVREYTGYVNTGPVVRLLLEVRFAFDRSFRLSDSRFLLALHNNIFRVDQDDNNTGLGVPNRVFD